jgi:hypothetical protein
MKTFMAIYLGSAGAPQLDEWNALDEEARKEKERAGMAAWGKWGEEHAASIVDNGPPIGKTKRVDPTGISDVTNDITGYAIVRAESHEAAAKLFLNHPHFTIFPGVGVEVMECLPMPEM